MADEKPGSASEPRQPIGIFRKSIPGQGRDVAIDMGSSTTLVYVRGKGIVLQEPSVIAIDKASGDVVAIGKEAAQMLERVPDTIEVIRPLRRGTVADFDTTERMLKHFLFKAIGKRPLAKPRVITTVSYGSSQVEKRAVLQAVQQAGTREAYLIEEPLAAAMGAHLPVDEATGSMVINIGGGRAEIAVLALGGVVNATSTSEAGDAWDEAIKDYLRREYLLEVGGPTAEKLKKQSGFACDPPPGAKTEITGIHTVTGLPKKVEITAQDITEALSHPLWTLIHMASRVFERTSPQLASDIIENGIVMTGGGAMLKNLDKLLSQELALPVRVADRPIECAALGAGKALTQTASLSQLALYRA